MTTRTLSLSTMFWLLLVVAIAVAWWKDTRRQQRQIESLQEQVEQLEQQPPITYYTF